MTFKEKIDNILKISGKEISSIHALEKKIDSGVGAISKYYRKNEEPGLGTIKKIIKEAGISKSWWDTGEGEIFDKNPTRASEYEPEYKKSNKQIPFYDTMAVGGSTIMADQSPITEPAGYVNPGDFFPKATGVMNVYGHSCFPKYPAGCKVAFKDADKDLIFWGEDYVIETSERRIIKRLEKHSDKNFVKAVSYNKSDSYVYADMDIPIIKIKRLFMVLGKVELEASI